MQSEIKIQRISRKTEYCQATDKIIPTLTTFLRKVFMLLCFSLHISIIISAAFTFTLIVIICKTIQSPDNKEDKTNLSKFYKKFNKANLLIHDFEALYPNCLTYWKRPQKKPTQDGLMKLIGVYYYKRKKKKRLSQ